MKKYIYALAAVLMLTGIAFALSNTNLFKGQAVTGPDTSGLPDGGGRENTDEIADTATATTGAGVPGNSNDATDPTTDNTAVNGPTGGTPTGGRPTGGTPTGGRPTGGTPTNGGEDGNVGYIGITVYAEDGKTIDSLYMPNGDFEIYQIDGTEVTDDAQWVNGANKDDGKYMISFSNTSESYYNIKVLADGYVSNDELKKVPVADSQNEVKYPSLTLEYAQALVINGEDGEPISNLDVYTGQNYETECHYWSKGSGYGSEYVCATPINSSKNYSVGGGGYITTLYEFANAARSSHDDAQRTKGWDGSFMLTSDEYAYTITLTDDSSGAVIEDANVSYRISGTSYSGSCEYTSDGIYWCQTSLKVDAGQIYYTAKAAGYEDVSGRFNEGRGVETDTGINQDVALTSTTATSPEDDDDDDSTDCDEGYTYDTVSGACMEDATDSGLDTDGDGLPDEDEQYIFGTSATDPDSDDDGLTDGEEVLTYGTDPLDVDSDSDGMDDYWELYYGLDPLTDDSAGDLDSDGYTNGEEYTNDTDPSVADAAADETCDTGYTYDTATETCIEDQVADDDDDDDEDDSSSTVARDDLTDEEVEEILSSNTYDCESPFTDISGHWGEDLICRAYQAGIVNGRDSDSFVPDDYVTRAELVKIILRNAWYEESDGAGLTEGFADVDATDWFYSFIRVAENLDVIRQRDAGIYFNPNNPITRADAVLYAIRLAGQTLYGYTASDVAFSDMSVNEYFTYAVVIANQKTVYVPGEGYSPIIEGYSDGTFRPYNYITRAEAVAFALRVHLAYYSR